MKNTDNFLQQTSLQKLVENLKMNEKHKGDIMIEQKTNNYNDKDLFNEDNLNENILIKNNKIVPLFLSKSLKNYYLIINGFGEIIIEKQETEQVWSSLVKKWFDENEGNPNISIIKVTSKNDFCPDTDNLKMTNFLKEISSIVNRTTLNTINK